MHERASKQATANNCLPAFPSFKPGQQVLVYPPYQAADRPNPKHLHPWCGPYVICSKLSDIMYRVRLPTDSKQVSVHLSHLKTYHPHAKPPAPDFDALGDLFLGKTIPLPNLDQPGQTLPRIESYVVDHIAGHSRGRGRPGPNNYVYRLRLKGYGPQSDVYFRAN